MFIQVIRGKVVDADGFERQNERWKKELMPETKGFIGSTGGVTPDGRFIIVARFESEALAMQNSDSDLQTQWWNETEKMLDDVTFTNLTDVQEWKNGGSDDAGFVQVMLGKVNDIEKAKQLDKSMSDSMPDDARPDMIGGTSGYTADGDFVATMYFTSEAAAREGEKKMNEMDPIPEMAEWGQIMVGELQYYDLPNPDLVTK